MVAEKKFRMRDVLTRDLETILAINEAAVPQVNSLDLGQLESLRAEAAYFRVMVHDLAVTEKVVAVLVGFLPAARYDSLNFRWFCRNYESFAYIDRIAVSENARRQGLADALYDDFEATFGHKVPLLACEVNRRPPNPASMAFHYRRGFREAGSQVLENGNKEVVMMVKPLEA